ncbi:hypothetical protein SS50377_23017 [Spironucleus salmonicida]|uniref:Uncharacterized protein n=1 Tax=Spironucleus salmonicida TaxID=348837 RepID=V6LTM3_9EUKA|nr:hypothetical protein SS50377_23017 [Spironucleus salmonicida]|eukprot:EST47598.1 Hypothetical protein SS50377_12291 [Spironucleus salmonicida]
MDEYFQQRLARYKQKIEHKRSQPEFLEFDLDFSDIRDQVNKVSTSISDEKHYDDLIKVYDDFFQLQDNQQKLYKQQQYSSSLRLASQQMDTVSVQDTDESNTLISKQPSTIQNE